MKPKKSLLIIFIAIVACYSCKTPSSVNSSMNNFVAIMEVKTPIPGVCDNSKVYAILPLPGNGQVMAKSPLDDTAIQRQLNADVLFLKDKSTFIDKGMVNLIVNCKGEMVRCEIDNKTQSPKLDSQIVAVFSKLKTWTPATIHGTSVDCSVLYSFAIKNGMITVK